MPLRPPLRAAVAPALVLSLALALPVTAQDRIPGGRLLTFGISTGLDASDNPDLDNEGDPEIAASTDLSLELLAATPTERFELGTNFGLVARAGGDPNEDDLTLSDPVAPAQGVERVARKFAVIVIFGHIKKDVAVRFIGKVFFN